jgi:hypothetical protein
MPSRRHQYAVRVLKKLASVCAIRPARSRKVNTAMDVSAARFHLVQGSNPLQSLKSHAFAEFMGKRLLL